MFNLPTKTYVILSIFVAASAYSYLKYLKYLKSYKRKTSIAPSNSDDENMKLWQPRKDSNASSLFFTESDNEYIHSNYEEIEPHNVEYQSLV